MDQGDITIFGGVTRRENSLSLREVAKFYGRGCSRGRLRQIERAKVLSSWVTNRYRVAIELAVAIREISRKVKSVKSDVELLLRKCSPFVN